MALSEKLYTLRKKSGLSQEQLAEQLSVSRQAISKWESGQSVPESDKLIVISNYFKVSLDYLLKEESEQETITETPATDDSMQTNDRTKWLLGIITCVGGILCLIVWGLLSILNRYLLDPLPCSHNCWCCFAPEEHKEKVIKEESL